MRKYWHTSKCAFFLAFFMKQYENEFSKKRTVFPSRDAGKNMTTFRHHNNSLLPPFKTQ